MWALAERNTFAAVAFHLLRRLLDLVRAADPVFLPERAKASGTLLAKPRAGAVPVLSGRGLLHAFICGSFRVSVAVNLVF